MVHQRNRRIYSVQGFFSYFDALWFEWCWINLFSKEMQNLFLDFWIQSWIFLKKTHPSVLPVHLTSVKILRGSVRDKRQHVYASWGAWETHPSPTLHPNTFTFAVNISVQLSIRLSCLVSWILLKVVKNTKWTTHVFKFYVLSQFKTRYLVPVFLQ